MFGSISTRIAAYAAGALALVMVVAVFAWMGEAAAKRQNKDLRVNIQMSTANPDEEPPLNAGHIFNVRIYNSRHSVTVGTAEG